MDTCTGDQPGHTSTKCQLLCSTLVCSLHRILRHLGPWVGPPIGFSMLRERLC